MRICVDIQPAVSQRAGVGRYTKYLVEHLGEFAGGDDVSLFYFDFHRRGLDFPVPGTRSAAVHWCPGLFAQQAWKRLHWPPFDWFAGRADVYHFPNFVIPPCAAGRKIVTIHDMSFLRHPGFAEPRNLRYLAAMMRRTVARADAILTVSRFSKSEIEALLPVEPARVFAVPLGVAPECAPPAPAAVAAFRAARKLDRPYLLTVGTIEPRKNIPFLVEVFERLGGFDGDLVIAGMRGWKYEPILERLRASSRADRIRYLDYLPDGQLAALYAGAELFVTPSHYEGFGFPPLEAMACGTAVVASPGGSLAEVLGDAAVIVPRFDPDLWAETLSALLSDTARREALRRGGPVHAARYTWRETARATWDVYRKVAS
jgi:glycosyltransferase involved in cell wall biosynthesis